MTRIIYLLALLAVTGCSSDTEIVEGHNWKYLEGYHAGDWLSGLSVVKDTIYSGKSPVAILKSVDYKLDHYYLNIVAIESKTEGIYTSK